MKKLLSSLVYFFVKRFVPLYYSGRYEKYRKKYIIHKKFRFNGDDILFYGNGTIDVGEGSYIGSYSSVQSVDGCRVIVGNGCQISHFVSFYTSNNAADKDYSSDMSMRSGDVIVGNYVWIGIKATIVGPVTIGENSCIAANSLVNRDIPPHCIAIGVPAKVVKFKSYLNKDQVSELVHQYRSVLSPELLEKYAL